MHIKTASNKNGPLAMRVILFCQKWVVDLNLKAYSLETSPRKKTTRSALTLEQHGDWCDIITLAPTKNDPLSSSGSFHKLN